MKKNKKFKTLPPLEAIHESARDLFESGAIDTITMKEFDALCLPIVKDLSAEDIQRLRKKEKVSQAIFAKFLNTSVSTIKQWELGEKHPRGTSLKLLNLVAQKGLKILI